MLRELTRIWSVNTWPLLAAILLLHGGRYPSEPPKDPLPEPGVRVGSPPQGGSPVPPPGSSGGAGRGAPSAPTPRGPGPTGPGPAGPRAPVTGDTEGTSDPTSWQLWWELNKEPFLQRRRSRLAAVTTGSGDFELGRGLRPSADDLLPVSAADRERVREALANVLAAGTAHREIVSASAMALARLGRADGRTLESFRTLLRNRDQEKREIGALCLGVSGAPAALPLLVDLALDTPQGRALVERDEVDYRTRSFAGYALGLLAHDASDDKVRVTVLATAESLLAAKRAERPDVQIAALQAIRLLRPDLRQWEGRVLRQRAIALLLSCLQRDDLAPEVRSHAWTAIAALEGREPESGQSRRLILDLLADPKSRPPLVQGAVVALGGMLGPDDEADVAGLRDFASRGRDPAARNLACIALGRIGGERNRDWLRTRLVQQRTRALDRPWLALGLSLASAGDDDAVRSVGGDIAEAFRSTANPGLASGLAIALGILRHKDSGPLLLERLEKLANDDEAAGYLAVALGLVDCQEARPALRALLDRSGRRPKVVRECSIGLALLGDTELTPLLLERLDKEQQITGFAGIALAVGYLADRRAVPHLVAVLADAGRSPFHRGYAAAALGLVCDPAELPWSSNISVDLSYLASVETLIGGGGGLLDIL